jgi:hypothetical protein
MKALSLSVLAGLMGVLIGTSCIATQAEARRMVHPHARAHVAAHNARHYRRPHVAHRYYRRGRWVNGVWVAGAVAAGVAAGTAAASNSCAYYWNRWHATGSTYWRNRYYDACD